MVLARGPSWRATGVHRFLDADDAALAFVPDLVLFLLNVVALVVVRRVCATAARRRFKHAVGQVVKLQRRLRWAGKTWRVRDGTPGGGEGEGEGDGGSANGGEGDGGRVRVRDAAIRVIVAARADAAAERGVDAASVSLSDLSLDDVFFGRCDPFADPLPRVTASNRAAAAYRAAGSLATAAAGAWTPTVINLVVFLAAAAHFISHAADRRVPRLVDAFGAVDSLRFWCAFAVTTPYVASVVETALGEIASLESSFGLAGGGGERVRGSLWRWICNTVGLWPMSDADGRMCCMSAEEAWSWAWCLIALALFAAGGDGPGAPGDRRDEASESESESASASASRGGGARRCLGACLGRCLGKCRAPRRRAGDGDAAAETVDARDVVVTLEATDERVVVVLTPTTTRRKKDENVRDDDEESDGDGEDDDGDAGSAATPRVTRSSSSRDALLRDFRETRERELDTFASLEPSSPVAAEVRRAESFAAARGVRRRRERRELDDFDIVKRAAQSGLLTAVASFGGTPGRVAADTGLRPVAGSVGRADRKSDGAKDADPGGDGEGAASVGRAGDDDAAVSRADDARRSGLSSSSPSSGAGEFLRNLAYEFWRTSGDAVSASVLALHARANGPLGGGSLPLAAAFVLSTSYPSLLSVPLLLWSLTPFIAPASWATETADFTREVAETKDVGDALRDVEQDRKASKRTDRETVVSFRSAADERDDADESAANTNTNTNTKAETETDTAPTTAPTTEPATAPVVSASEDPPPTPLTTRTTTSAAARVKFDDFFARRRGSVRVFVDAVDAHVRGRYRALHIVAASYAVALVLLDYGSRLAAEIRFTDAASSNTVFFGAVFFGPARRASAAPTLLLKLALAACMLRPHEPREPELRDELADAAEKAREEAEEAGRIADALENAADDADAVDVAVAEGRGVERRGGTSSEGVGEGDGEGDDEGESDVEDASVPSAALAFEPDSMYLRGVRALDEERAARRQSRALARAAEAAKRTRRGRG